jgi:hypothetical protein
MKSDSATRCKAWKIKLTKGDSFSLKQITSTIAGHNLESAFKSFILKGALHPEWKDFSFYLNTDIKISKHKEITFISLTNSINFQIPGTNRVRPAKWEVLRCDPK